MVAWMRLVLLGPERDRAAARPRLVAARDRLPGPPAEGGRHHLPADRGLHPDGRHHRSRDAAAMRRPIPTLMRREAMAAPLGTGFIVSALLALRVSFGLAATTVDLPLVAAPLLGLWPRQRLDDHRQPVRDPVRRRRRDQHRRHRAARPAAQPRRRHRRRRGHLDHRDPRLLRQRRLVATTQAVIFRRLTAWREGVPLA